MSYYDRAYTSLGEKIATVIGYVILVALLAVLMIGYQITI
jgi:hypothetical protein